MSQVSRQALVNAGIEILLEDGHAVLTGRSGLSIERVLARAGYSPGTFFRINKLTKDDFIDELLPALVTEVPGSITQLADVVAATLAENEGNPLSVVRALARENYELVRDTPHLRQRLLALTIGGGHAATRRALAASYRQHGDVAVQAYEQVLATWGAALRKPFTTSDLAQVLAALAEGLALRALATGGEVPDELFGNTVVALLPSVLDLEQRHEHINDVAGPLAAQIRVKYQAEALDQLPDDLAGTLIRAARTEFGERSYFGTTMTNIAQRAEIPLSTAKAVFPTKTDIVVAALIDGVAGLRRQVATDVRVGRQAPDIVRRHLRRLAELSLSEIEFTEALISIVSHDTAAAPDTAVAVKEALDLPGLIEPVIAAATAAGAFTGLVEAREAAAILTNTLLLRCFTRRHRDAGTIADEIGTLLLDGLLAGR